MIKNISMVACLVVTVVFIWVWHHQSQFNDHSRKGFFHLRNGELDASIDAYKKAIKNKSRTIFFAKEPSAYNNLGQAYLHKGDYDAAIAAFKTALAMEPNAVEAHINLSTAYLKQNLPDLTIETCQQALQRFPNVALLHYNLACGYALKGRGAEAVDALERACNLDSRLRGLARDEPALESLHAHPLLSND